MEVNKFNELVEEVRKLSPEEMDEFILLISQEIEMRDEGLEYMN